MQSTIWNSIQNRHYTLNISFSRKQLEVYWCKLILSSDLVPQTKRLSLIRNSDGNGSSYRRCCKNHWESFKVSLDQVMSVDMCLLTWQSAHSPYGHVCTYTHTQFKRPEHSKLLFKSSLFSNPKKRYCLSKDQYFWVCAFLDSIVNSRVCVRRTPHSPNRKLLFLTQIPSSSSCLQSPPVIHQNLTYQTIKTNEEVEI